MLRAILISACVGLAGCSAVTRTKTGEWPEKHEYSRHLDDAVARGHAEKRGLAAVSKCYPYADHHFRQGFIQAYVDVALGANGRTPPVPPERYWKVCERDPDGYVEAEHWFAGYEAGAQRALASCWHAHNQVPASGVYCKP